METISWAPVLTNYAASGRRRKPQNSMLVEESGCLHDNLFILRTALLDWYKCLHLNENWTECPSNRRSQIANNTSKFLGEIHGVLSHGIPHMAAPHTYNTSIILDK